MKNPEYKFTHSKELIVGAANKERILQQHLDDVCHLLEIFEKVDQLSHEDVLDLKQKASLLREKLDLNKHEYHHDYHHLIEEKMGEVEEKVGHLLGHTLDGNQEKISEAKEYLVGHLSEIKNGFDEHNDWAKSSRVDKIGNDSTGVRRFGKNPANNPSYDGDLQELFEIESF